GQGARRRRPVARPSRLGGRGPRRAAGGRPGRGRAAQRTHPARARGRGMGAGAMIAAIVIVVVVLAVIGLAAAGASVRVLREYERGVVFRLGRLMNQRGPGLVLLVPTIDRMVKVSLRTVTLTVPPQEIITRDNVPARVTAVTYYRVIDANDAVNQVENFHNATLQIA